MKVAELGISRAVLDLGKKMEKEGKEIENMKLYFAASDIGEAEVISKLVEFCRR